MANKRRTKRHIANLSNRQKQYRLKSSKKIHHLDITEKNNQSIPDSSTKTIPDTSSLTLSKTLIPSQSSIEHLPDTVKKLALQWYKMGIKRGFSEATYLMANDDIFKKDDRIQIPEKISFLIKTRFGDESIPHMNEFIMTTKSSTYDKSTT